MLCCVPAYTVYSGVIKQLNVAFNAVLYVLVFGVEILQTEKVTVGYIRPVTVISYSACIVPMILIFMFIEPINIDLMICDHIHYDLNSVLIRLFTKCSEISLLNVVCELHAYGLIYKVPAHTFCVTVWRKLSRRQLYSCEARGCDLPHRSLYISIVPTEAMKDSSLLATARKLIVNAATYGLCRIDRKTHYSCSCRKAH